MVLSERSRSTLSKSTLFKKKKKFVIYKNKFLGEKWDFICFFLQFFSIESLLKYSDFVNSDDWIGKISPRSIKNSYNIIDKLVLDPWNRTSIAPFQGVVKFHRS